MRILVTGANGFIGTALCAALRTRGIAFTAAMRHAAPDATSNVVAVGAIDAATDWSAALAGCDVVVHLAGQAHRPVDGSAQELAALHETNVLGTAKLTRQAAATGVRRLVFLSSIKAWGESTESGQAASEDDVCQPQDAYGRSKFAAEQALLRATQGTEMHTTIIRPPLVYGPQAKANFALLVRAVRAGWPLPLGAIDNLRSFIALENLVDFIVLCTQHPAAVNQTLHISDGADLSTPALVRGIALALGVQARLLPVSVALLGALAWPLGRTATLQGLTGNLQLDISRARQHLGWKPPLSVTEGLRRAVAGQETP